jgi:predicted Zn-dependent protease
MRIARVSLALAGLIAAGWFALGIRQAHDIDRVTSIVVGLNGQSRLSPARAASANSMLDSAATLDPDRMVDVLRARVALLRGDRARAKRILLGVLADEPKNLDAWYGLATSAYDNATVTHALGQIARLEPTART